MDWTKRNIECREGMLIWAGINQVQKETKLQNPNDYMMSNFELACVALKAAQVKNYHVEAV